MRSFECAQCSLCHPDGVALCWTGFSCAAVLGHHLPWGETNERGRKIYCVFSQHIIDTGLLIPPPSFPPILISCLILSLQVTACLHRLKVQEEGSEAPVPERTLSDTWVGRRRGVAGAMHQGWGGFAAGDTHSVGRGGGRGRSVRRWSSNSAWWCCVPCSSCLAWPRSSCWMEARARQPAGGTSERFARSVFFPPKCFLYNTLLAHTHSWWSKAQELFCVSTS